MFSAIPSELENIYDSAEYEKHCKYLTERRKFKLVTNFIDTILLLVILQYGTIGMLLEICNKITQYTVWGDILFIVTMIIVTTLYSTPFNIYLTFVIEQKYGFNKTTVKTFIGDEIKSLILSTLFTVGIYTLIFQYYEYCGKDFWIYAWIAISLFLLIINLFYSQTIAPLFNKQTPLENGELKYAIEKFASEHDFRIKNIFVIDGSKHSTKANAYFTGIGRYKRVVLYDTLIKQINTDEIIAVLAHEIGHYKNHDIIRNIAMSVISMGIYLYIFSYFAGSETLAQALGGKSESFILSILGYGLIFSPITLIIAPFLNKISQKAEFKADEFATNSGYGQHLIAGLKRLTANNLSPLMIHPAYVLFYCSHPTLLQRINKINSKIK